MSGDGLSMMVHRLVIDSWPTPDGKPFVDQPEEVWQAAVDHWAGNEGGTWPSWLPESLDITEWLPTEDEYRGSPVKNGDAIGGFYERLMNVPRPPLRKHFFIKSAAQKVLAELVEWGVIGHIESSEPIVWRVAS